MYSTGVDFLCTPLSPCCIFTTSCEDLGLSSCRWNSVWFGLLSLMARENHFAHTSILSGLWAPSKKKTSSFDCSLLKSVSATIWALPCKLALVNPFMNCSGKVSFMRVDERLQQKKLKRGEKITTFRTYSSFRVCVSKMPCPFQPCRAQCNGKTSI